MNVGTITSEEETFANVDDLIYLFLDIKEHPEKYNKDAVITFIGQLAGKIPIKKKMEIDRPF